MKTRNTSRNKKAFALLSILVIGTFSMFFLLALAEILLSVSRSESLQRQKDLLLDAVDTTVDYAIDSLNHDPNIFTPGVSYSVPQTYFSDGLSTAKFHILPAIATNDWDNNIKVFSSLYAPGMVPTALVDLNRIGVNDNWKVLEVTAKRGIFEKSVRLILQPMVSSPTGLNVTGGSSNPLFTQPIFANSQISFSGTTDISDSIDPDAAVKVQSNSAILLTPGSNLTLPGEPGISSSELNAPSITSSDATNQATLKGNINTNGDATNVNNPGYTTNQAAGVNPISQSPAPLSDSSALTLPDNSADPGNPAKISAPLAGSYTVPNITPASSALPYTVSGSDTASIYIEGDSNNPNAAVDINASQLVNSTGNPSALQIFYNGNQPIKIHADANFSGLIYAPNAQVEIAMSPSNTDFSTTFSGAVSALNVSLNIPKIKLLNSVSSSGGGGNPKLVYYTDGATNASLFFKGFQPVVWQEVNANQLVP
jgi:hypothetical protein